MTSLAHKNCVPYNLLKNELDTKPCYLHFLFENKKKLLIYRTNSKYKENLNQIKNSTTPVWVLFQTHHRGCCGLYVCLCFTRFVLVYSLIWKIVIQYVQQPLWRKRKGNRLIRFTKCTTFVPCESMVNSIWMQSKPFSYTFTRLSNHDYSEFFLCWYHF